MLRKKLTKIIAITLLGLSLLNPIKAFASQIIEPFMISESSVTYYSEGERQEARGNILLFNTHTNEKNEDESIIDITKNFADQLEAKGFRVDYIDKDFVGNNYNNAYNQSNAYLKGLDLSTYDLILDCHIDALASKVTTEVDGKDSAKMMFVFSRASHNYREGKELAKNIKKYAPTQGFFRDDYEYDMCKSNGNNNLSDKLLLVEMGFNTNTYIETRLATNILADCIDNYFNE